MKLFRRSKRLKENSIPVGKFTQEFNSHRIPYGVYGIIGRQGAGKTSLAMAMILSDYKYHAAERFELADRFVDEFNRQNPSKPLEYSGCQYRTRTELTLPNGSATGHIDIWQFGLPSPDKPYVQFLPPSSIVFFDEIDSYMDCRKFSENKQYIIDGFKYPRHIDLSIMYDCQSFWKVDIAIRRLTTDLLYVKGQYNEYKRLRRFSKRKTLVKTVWDIIWIKDEDIPKEAGETLDLNKGTPCRYEYVGNVYKQYNSYGSQALWYNGIGSSFTNEAHAGNNLSRSSIERFCTQNKLNKEAISSPKKGGISEKALPDQGNKSGNSSPSA